MLRITGKLYPFFADVQKKLMNKQTMSDKINEVLYARTDVRE